MFICYDTSPFFKPIIRIHKGLIKETLKLPTTMGKNSAWVNNAI